MVPVGLMMLVMLRRAGDSFLGRESSRTPAEADPPRYIQSGNAEGSSLAPIPASTLWTSQTRFFGSGAHANEQGRCSWGKTMCVSGSRSFVNRYAPLLSAGRPAPDHKLVQRATMGIAFLVKKAFAVRSRIRECTANIENDFPGRAQRKPSNRIRA